MYKSGRTRLAVRSLTFFVATILAGYEVQGQESSSVQPCSEGRVHYTPAEMSVLEKQIRISEMRKSVLDTNKSTKKQSPQATRYLSVKSPDFAKPGPWTTDVFIGGVGLNEKELDITVLDHGNGGVRTDWVNEKLLFIQVWWGRIVSTDLIFDVDARRFVYQENAEYSDTVRVCN
jgi:hypothetical protein